MSGVISSGVIFDLDGTLADTLADIAAAMNHVLAARGLPTHPDDAYRRFVGSGVTALAERALPAAARGARDEVAAAFRRRYAAHALDRTRPYPGVPALLDALAARGVPVAIHSNKPDGFTREVTAALFGRWTFAVVAGARDDVPRKPDPTVTLAIARTLGAPPPRCLFVGDSDVDIETGRNAGMRTVGVAWGFRGAAELRRAGADHLVDAPLELLPLLPDPAP